MKELKLAFTEYYLSLVLIQNYQVHKHHLINDNNELLH